MTSEGVPPGNLIYFKDPLLAGKLYDETTNWVLNTQVVYYYKHNCIIIFACTSKMSCYVDLLKYLQQFQYILYKVRGNISPSNV